MTAASDALGAYGEARAARWYERHGYVVLDRNWRCRDGELDLILEGEGVVVFSEVKTRSSGAYGSPLSAVTPAKQRRIRKLALAWLREHDRGFVEIRFDVVGIVGSQIEVLFAAF